MRSVLRCLTVLVLVFGFGSARAVPCVAGSLGDYLALDPGGCTIGGVTVAGFTLPDLLSPAATPIDPGTVSITPVASAPGVGLALAFAPPPLAAAGAFLALRIGFDVQASGIAGAQAALIDPVPAGDAAITLIEDLCLGASFLDATNLTCAMPTQTLVAIAIDGFADNPVASAIGPVGFAGVVAEIGVDAGLAGSATLAGAELRFLQAAAVPSPSVLALLALGAAAAGLCTGRARRLRATA